jgi:hypothetical protein
VRVPLLNASLTDCVFEVTRATSVTEVNELLQSAAEGPLKGVLGYEERPLVSVDFKGDPRSAIVDGPSTMVVDRTQVKVLAWYDNEWGYVSSTIWLNSAVHSYLILAYTDSDKVAMNVGFYYMANAGGRLAGTVLSGLLYQYSGLIGCLWACAGLVLASAVLARLLPVAGQVRVSLAAIGGDD